MERLSALGAAVVGGTVALAFALIHALLIASIWFNIVPMVLSGCLCGASIEWSYSKAVSRPSTLRWIGHNAALVVLLVAVGAASLVVFDPRFTMMEVTDSPDAVFVLLPAALPLMGVGALAGALILWLAYRRRRGSFLPLLTAQVLLVVFIGHNLAILGLVEITAESLYLLAEFVGLTVSMGVMFIGGTVLWNRLLTDT